MRKSAITALLLLALAAPVPAQVLSCPQTVTLRSETSAALSFTQADNNFSNVRSLCTWAATLTWKGTVADVASLPGTSTAGHCYGVASDAQIRCWTGSAWTVQGASATLAGDVDGTAGSNDLDEAAVESELEGVLDLDALQGAVTDAQVPNTITVDLATTATTANAGDSATAFFSSGTIEVARGGTGAAPGADDQVLVSDSTSAATWRAVPDSDAAGTILGYDTATNAWSTKADDDVPEGGDFGALALTGDVTSSGLATTIGADKVLESMLKVVDSPADEECLTREDTTGDFEWQTCNPAVGSDKQVYFNDNGTTAGDAGLTYDKATDALTAGRYLAGGSAPSVGGSCGTSPSVAGKDSAIKITTGTGTPTSCQVTFAASWATAPVCVANASATTTALNVATTTTTVTVSAAALTASETIHVLCVGY